MAASSTTLTAPSKAVRNGDFAGLSSTFDAKTAKLIPIPEYYVPQDLLDWGQAPVSLEHLVSEDLPGTRHTVTALPAAGCGVDNLDTIKSTEEVDEASIWNSEDGSVWSLCYPFTSGKFNRLRVETCFGVLPLDGEGEVADETRSCYRSRVSIDLQLDNYKIEVISPLRVSLERQTATTSTGGTVADGGLDARTVAERLGSKLSSREVQDSAGQDVSNYKWNATDGDASNELFPVQLILPGNMTLSYGEQDNTFILEMGYIHAKVGLRQVVRRTFETDLSTKQTVSRTENGELRC